VYIVFASFQDTARFVINLIKVTFKLFPKSLNKEIIPQNTALDLQNVRNSAVNAIYHYLSLLDCTLGPNVPTVLVVSADSQLQQH